jgi:hypothetical protein
MSYVELREKFDENASGFLSADERNRPADEITQLELLRDASTLADLAIQASPNRASRQDWQTMKRESRQIR